MARQAIGFGKLAPNIMVKMPASAAGIKAFEEATFAGISINATVSFTVAQAVAVAEAVERGLKRREEAGLSNENMTPVCTIMVGRTDDWVKEAVKRDNLCLDPCALEYAGVAVFKNAYKIYQERGYKTRFVHYGAFVKTMNQFLGGYESLLGVIRKLMVGEPVRK